MRSRLRRIRDFFYRLMYRRNYYVSKIWSRKIPAAPLHYVPDGFSVNVIGDTGIKVIENFLSGDEADYLVSKARERLEGSQIIVDGKGVTTNSRTSSHAVVFHRYQQDPHIVPILARGAMLAGVPADNAEQVYVSRYSEGELYHGHYDISHDFLTSHRLCTMLIYLNTLEEGQGGETYFRDLNIAVKPTRGRAVCWTNMNPDGSPHLETMHAALPPSGPDIEKWVIQLWFRPYGMNPVDSELEPLQAKPGAPLTDDTTLPAGVFLAKSEPAL